MYFTKHYLLAIILIVLLSKVSYGQERAKDIDITQALSGYFKPAGEGGIAPDTEGFITRWMLLEPISRPNRNNSVFTMEYTREQLTKEWFSGQMDVIPKDGDMVIVEMEYQAPVDLTSNRPRTIPSETPKMVKAQLTWHALDSDHFFVKLFRFATGLNKNRYGVIFWSVTILNCEEDIENVRLAVGSNKGAMWWLNEEELLLLASDRHMGVDSAVSKRVTLHKGKNVLRGATINGPGMSEFCVRFIDDYGTPVRNFTVSCN